MIEALRTPEERLTNLTTITRLLSPSWVEIANIA